MAPPFSLPEARGRTYSLPEALAHGPVLLAFFKGSCPVCQFTFPFLERLYQAAGGKDSVQLWGISQDDARDTQDFAREYGCSFPLLLDEPNYPVSNAYGLTNVPTLFWIEPGGRIAQASVGFERRMLEEVAAEMGKLNGRSITVFQPSDLVPDHKPG